MRTKKVAGIAHVGIGDDRRLDGVTRARTHTDLQVLDVTVEFDELDGRTVVVAGQLRLL